MDDGGGGGVGDVLTIFFCGSHPDLFVAQQQLCYQKHTVDSSCSVAAYDSCLAAAYEHCTASSDNSDSASCLLICLSMGYQLTQQQSSYREQLVEDSCTTAADDSSQARCLLICSVNGVSADPAAVQLPGAAG